MSSTSFTVCQISLDILLRSSRNFSGLLYQIWGHCSSKMHREKLCYSFSSWFSIVYDICFKVIYWGLRPSCRVEHILCLVQHPLLRPWVTLRLSLCLVTFSYWLNIIICLVTFTYDPFHIFPIITDFYLLCLLASSRWSCRLSLKRPTHMWFEVSYYTHEYGGKGCQVPWSPLHSYKGRRWQIALYLDKALLSCFSF